MQGRRSTSRPTAREVSEVSDMSEFDQVEDLEPAGTPDEEEYAPDEPDLVVSPDTGTVYYDEEGAAELTPRDLESDDEDGE